jgi:hypothetical protein
MVKPDVVSVHVIEGILKPIGAKKLIANLSANSLQKISAVYHDVTYNLFDNDILTIQMMSMILPKNVNMYEFIVRQYFSYTKEITEYLLDFKLLQADDAQTFGPLIEDFFRFLIYLMTDETCLVNNLWTRDPKVYIEQHSNNDRIRRVTKRVIINILSCYTWIDLNDLQETIKQVLNVSNYDEILGETAVFDEKIKKMRIKEEYFQDYDPYMFYGRKKVQDQLKELFVEKMKKSSNVDLYSGFYYTDLPIELYQLQYSLVDSLLIPYLSKILMFNKQEYKKLAPIHLKMLLFVLNASEHLLNIGFECSDLFS